MNVKHRVAIIGFGSIGRTVVKELLGGDAAPGFDLAVLQRKGSKSLVELPNSVKRFVDLDGVLDWKPQLVVETAGQMAVGQYGPTCLNAGVPFLISSTGALASEALRLQIEDAARSGATKAIVISGAIGALDYLGAAARLPGARVVYESRKPLAAWVAELRELGLSPDAMTEPVVLFDGDAETAAQRYPKNLNVAATLALAGVGMRDTAVRVVADPGVDANTHVIRVEGPAGTFEGRIVNAPSSDNPKTSAIVAFSVVNAIHRHFSPLQFA
jgi:aspartate dehydrogenase